MTDEPVDCYSLTDQHASEGSDDAVDRLTLHVFFY